MKKRLPFFAIDFNINFSSSGVSQLEILAFRGYFEFDDVIASIDMAESRIKVTIKDNATGVSSIIADSEFGVVYDLQGRKISKQTTGIQISKGKKILIK